MRRHFHADARVRLPVEADVLHHEADAVRLEGLPDLEIRGLGAPLEDVVAGKGVDPVEVAEGPLGQGDLFGGLDDPHLQAAGADVRETRLRKAVGRGLSLRRIVGTKSAPMAFPARPRFFKPSSIQAKRSTVLPLASAPLFGNPPSACG